MIWISISHIVYKLKFSFWYDKIFFKDGPNKFSIKIYLFLDRITKSLLDIPSASIILSNAKDSQTNDSFCFCIFMTTSILKSFSTP